MNSILEILFNFFMLSRKVVAAIVITAIVLMVLGVCSNNALIILLGSGSALILIIGISIGAAFIGWYMGRLVKKCDVHRTNLGFKETVVIKDWSRYLHDVYFNF